MEDDRYWLALNRVPGVGNILFKRLIEAYKQPEVIFETSEKALVQVEGVSERIVNAIHSFQGFDGVDQELDRIEKYHGKLLTLNDAEYPRRLFEIDDPPPFLYAKGNWEEENSSNPIAVVGARRTTAYGRKIAEQLCFQLAENGITIVSGFARGVDGVAHRAALKAGGQTIAVLGCGIDVIYPPEHKKLYHDIMEQGVIFSEFPMGTPPIAHNFPKRNRMISGLSLGCLVVEAGLKSGSLITARCAMEQGREVFAVPGSVYSELSAGPHQLIASGAKLVKNVEDILEEIYPQQTLNLAQAKPALPTLEAEEALVFQSLSFDPKHIDLLIQESQKPAAAISGLLLTLELKGVARQMSGQYYVKV